MPTSTLQLFHRISDGESARVRRLIVEMNLGNIQFRNVDVSDESNREITKALGQVNVPAIRTEDGKWIVGFDAIETFFRSQNAS